MPKDVTLNIITKQKWLNSTKIFPSSIIDAGTISQVLVLISFTNTNTESLVVIPSTLKDIETFCPLFTKDWTSSVTWILNIVKIEILSKLLSLLVNSSLTSKNAPVSDKKEINCSLDSTASNALEVKEASAKLNDSSNALSLVPITIILLSDRICPSESSTTYS